MGGGGADFLTADLLRVMNGSMAPSVLQALREVSGS